MNVALETLRWDKRRENVSSIVLLALPCCHRFCVTRIVLGQKSDLFLCKILRKIFPCDFNKRSENESHKEKRRRRSRSDFFHRARLINKWASRFQPVIGKTMIHRSKIWPQIRFKRVLAGKLTSSSSFHVANLHFCGWRLKLNSLLFGQFLRFAQKKMWRGQKWVPAVIFRRPVLFRERKIFIQSFKLMLFLKLNRSPHVPRWSAAHSSLCSGFELANVSWRWLEIWTFHLKSMQFSSVSFMQCQITATVTSKSKTDGGEFV